MVSDHALKCAQIEVFELLAAHNELEIVGLLPQFRRQVELRMDLLEKGIYLKFMPNMRQLVRMLVLTLPLSYTCFGRTKELNAAQKLVAAVIATAIPVWEQFKDEIVDQLTRLKNQG